MALFLIHSARSWRLRLFLYQRCVGEHYFGKRVVCADVRTCGFVADQFTVLHLADGREQGIDVVLRHGLRQVVDDDVRLADVITGRIKRRPGWIRCRQMTAAVVLQ